MKKNIFLLLVTSVFLIVSCKKEAEIKKDESLNEEFAVSQADKKRTDFAKALAKAIMNQRVRQIINEEALKKFDNDFDVLFYHVKDKELEPGLTLSEYIASFAAPGEITDDLTRELPLLTILVPELSGFSASRWDVNSQIPIVAVVNSNFDEKQHKVIAFDHAGNRIELASN